MSRVALQKGPLLTPFCKANKTGTCMLQNLVGELSDENCGYASSLDRSLSVHFHTNTLSTSGTSKLMYGELACTMIL